MRELALFAGAGGGILGGLLLGWRTVCAVELDAYCRNVLLARQRDGYLDPFPIWDDVRTFDGKPWRGHVDVVSGGFPCQDISAAGKGAGIDGERSGLWGDMARIISEVRPHYALVENSPSLTSRGLGRVLGDLAAMGMDARWGVLSAADTGAPHLRERIWILAHSPSDRFQRCGTGDSGRDATSPRRKQLRRKSGRVGPDGDSPTVSDPPRVHAQGLDHRPRQGESRRSDWWGVEPAVGRVVDGLAHRVDRLRAIGNGQVPAVVRLAWETLAGDIK